MNCDGVPSNATIRLLKDLDRLIPITPNTVHMFGTNLDVDMFNHHKLEKLTGNQIIFKSDDTADKKVLRNCASPMALALKLNCKVLITQNLSNGLVNGLTGTVIAIKEDHIDVKIDQDENLRHNLQGKTFRVECYSFLV